MNNTLLNYYSMCSSTPFKELVTTIGGAIYVTFSLVLSYYYSLALYMYTRTSLIWSRRGLAIFWEGV